MLNLFEQNSSVIEAGSAHSKLLRPIIKLLIKTFYLGQVVLVVRNHCSGSLADPTDVSTVVVSLTEKTLAGFTMELASVV